jgi:mono/diheme cytochrome c family protein
MNTSKQVNVIILLIFLSIFATGAYTLWDPDRADSAKDRQEEIAIERGAWLYSQNCRTCHGDEGEGGGASNRLRAAPPLNRPDLQGIGEDGEVDDTARAQAYRLVVNTIVCGRVGRAMPTWGIEQGGTLNDEQIRQLALLITQGGEEGWAHAKEFALEGVPAFDKHGDAFNHLEVAEPVAADDTTIVLNRFVDSISPNVRLQVGEELVLVQEVDPETRTVTVERGIGTTDGVDHEVGTQILEVPEPPAEPVPTVAAACGQIAQASSTPEPLPASDELAIVAQGIAWNRSSLTAIANVPLTILVDNEEADATVHNIHFFQGAEPGGDELPADQCAGMADGCFSEITAEDVTFEFGPLPVGEYYYICDVHPQMEGVLSAVEPGTASPGAGTGDDSENEAPSDQDAPGTDPAAGGTPIVPDEAP